MTHPSTPAGRAALREMAAAATELPWLFDGETWTIWSCGEIPIADISRHTLANYRADGSYVAAACNAIVPALDTIDRLTAALAAAREALAPFALEISPDRPDWIPQHIVCKVGDCRAACAALGEGREGT